MTKVASNHHRAALLFVLVLLAAASTAMATPPISWQPKTVSKIIFPGVPIEETVTLVSSISYGKVTLVVVPELQPFLSVEPTSFPLVANVPTTVRLLFSAPASAVEDTLDGTVHVRAGGTSGVGETERLPNKSRSPQPIEISSAPSSGPSATLPQTLKVHLIIGGPSILSPPIQTSAAAADSFASWTTTFGQDQARTMVLDFVRAQACVDSAGFNDDSTAVGVVFWGGLDGLIPTGDEEALGTPSAPTALVASPLFSDPKIGPAASLECTFVHDELAGTSCFRPDAILTNSSVTVNALKSLSNYAVISIFTHGAVDLFSNVVLMTGDPLPKTLPFVPGYLEDWASGRIETYGHNWAIKPAFIRHYAGRYPNSLVLISACQSMDNTSMSSAFLENGAAAYFGWLHEVCDGSAARFKGVLLQRLIDDHMSTGAAFDAWTLAQRTDGCIPRGSKKKPIYQMAGARDLTLCPKPAGLIADLRGPQITACDGPVVGSTRIQTLTNGDIDFTETFTTGPVSQSFQVFWTCTNVANGCHDQACSFVLLGVVATNAAGQGAFHTIIAGGNPFPGKFVHIDLIASGITQIYTSTFGSVPGLSAQLASSATTRLDPPGDDPGGGGAGLNSLDATLALGKGTSPKPSATSPAPSDSHVGTRVASAGGVVRYETTWKSGPECDIHIHDMAGRIVQHMRAHVDADGKVRFSWDGTIPGGGKARAGIYFVRISSPTAVSPEIGRVILLR